MTPSQIPLPHPLVSVVIPCYNRAPLIPRAIKSVQAQNFDSLEIILVDDGSADDTPAVVARFQADDPRVRFVRHERNRGEAAARNTGVINAQGKYIAFLDSDDEWLPGKLKIQIEALSRADKSVGGCFTGAIQVTPEGRESVVNDWSRRLRISDLNILTEGCGLAMGTTSMVLRTAYDTIGYYDEALPLLVDVDWLCRFVQAYPVIKVQQPLARYHKAPMRRGESMEQAVAAFVNKNADYLSKFSRINRWKIDSRFFAYISQSYEVHGPHSRFVITRGQCLLFNPFQPLNTYLHWIAALFHVIHIGETRR